jgi:hypothetical protein
MLALSVTEPGRRLLSKAPATFDPRSRRYILGLATIFAAE